MTGIKTNRNNKSINMRKKIVAGNWKMNLNLQDGIDLAKSVRQHFHGKTEQKAEVVICPPFIHLPGFNEVLEMSKIAYGAQNCASKASGAFTGEVSCDMIKSTGASYVIIGHSERRTYFSESDELLYKKVNLAIKSGLKVIFCCGEVIQEREKRIHFDVVKRQLDEGLFGLSDNDFINIIIAYEPVWAIGTGLTASPDQAQEMHKYIRDLITNRYGVKRAESTSILYGGSCKPSNAAEIFAKPDVDGGLIGGASLKSSDFCAIVEAV
jgi:triosephosphate isomerase